MDRNRLYERLKSINEPKDYFFNHDLETTMFLLDGLIANTARYGYMACPCRLAHQDREKDRDIICPCVYREADVREFGSCYCGLYVSKEWNNGHIAKTPVPERRPVEKC